MADSAAADRVRAAHGAVAENPALTAILQAVRRVLRDGDRVELPGQGIDVELDSGIVAVCRCCRTAWRLKRRQFNTLAWWSCPGGCRPAE